MVILIRNTAEEAWLCGKDLLRGLEHAYRELELARYQRSELVEIGTLHTKMKALETRIEAAKPHQSDDYWIRAQFHQCPPLWDVSQN